MTYIKLTNLCFQRDRKLNTVVGRAASLSSLLAGALIAAVTPIASAQNSTWTGNGSNTNWGTAANWDTVPTATDSVIIGTGGSAANLNGPQTVNELIFTRGSDFTLSDSSGSASGLTITSGDLTFGVGGTSNLVSHLISSSVTLGSNATWVSRNPSLTRDPDYVADPALYWNLKVSGDIKETTPGTKLTVQVGPGPLLLSGNNTFSGGVEVTGTGQLWFENTKAIGGGNLTVSKNSTGNQVNYFGEENGGSSKAIFDKTLLLNAPTGGRVILSAGRVNDQGFQLNEIAGVFGNSTMELGARGKTITINSISATGSATSGIQLFANTSGPNTYELGSSSGANNILLGVGAGAGSNFTANLLFINQVTQTGNIILGSSNTGVNTIGITHLGGNSTISGTFSIANAATAGSVNVVAKDSGSRLTFSNLISGGAGLKINDSWTDVINGTNLASGTVRLARAAGNTYTGTTMVHAGTLIVSNATGSATGTGNVSVQDSATLGGGGIIEPGGTNGISVESGGLVSPGDGGIATLGFSGASTTGPLLTMLSDAKFKMELGPTLSSDTINFLSYVGATDFVRNSNVIDISFLSGATTGTYRLFNFYSDAGTTFTASGFNSGLSLNFTNGGSGTLDYGTTGQINLVVTAIPEPSTWALLALGLTVAIIARRRSVRTTSTP